MKETITRLPEPYKTIWCRYVDYDNFYNLAPKVVGTRLSAFRKKIDSQYDLIFVTDGNRIAFKKDVYNKFVLNLVQFIKDQPRFIQKLILKEKLDRLV